MSFEGNFSLSSICSSCGHRQTTDSDGCSCKSYQVDHEYEDDPEYLHATSFEHAAELYAERVVYEHCCHELIGEKISIQVSLGNEKRDYMVMAQESVDFSAELVEEKEDG